MEESKGSRVDVIFSECTIPVEFDQSALELQASIRQNSQSVKIGGSASISTSVISAELPLELRLLLGGEEVASGSVPLGSLGGKSLAGDFECQLSLEPSSGSPIDSASVRISGSVYVTKKQGKGKLSNLTVSPQKRAKCPYLKKLLSVEDSDREIQTTLLRVKQRLGPDYSDLFEHGVRSPVLRSPGKMSPTRSAGRSPLRQSKKDYAEVVPDDTTYLELPSRFDLTLENLSSVEPQLLKNVAIALSEKIQVMKVQVEEYETIQEVLLTFEGPMNDLQESIKETQGQITDEEAKIDEVISKVRDENKSLEEELKSTKSRRVDVENEIQELKGHIEGLKTGKEKPAKTTTATVEELQAEIVKQEEAISQLHKSYEKALSDFTENAEKLDLERTKLLEEKGQALGRLHSLKTQLDHAELESIQLAGTCASLSASLSVQKDQEDRIHTLTAINEEYTKANASTSEQIAKFSKDIDTNTTQSNNLIKKIENDINDLKALQAAVESEKEGKEKLKDQYQTSLDEAHVRLDEIQSMLDNRKNINEELEQAYKEFVHENEVQEDVLCEMAYFSDLVFSQAQTGLTAHRLYSRLVDMIDEKAYQKSSLKSMITSIKKAKPAYVPKKDDPVDVLLGRLLSKREATLDVNFVRNAPGAYTFGTREVGLKQQGNSLVVAFDNKSMPLEDFIEGYTLIETEKLTKRAEERKSVSPKRATKSAKK